MPNESGRIVLQRIVGVLITLTVFGFLTVRGEVIPERVQRLMVLGVGSLIVGVEGITGLIRIVKSIKFTVEEEENRKEQQKKEQDKVL